MSKHSNMTTDLTKNQALVMGALSEASGPLSAYTILDELRDHGFRAPLQVYRALDKLLEIGLVHRLESLNAFVACQHPSCESQKSEMVVFTICQSCEGVQELVDKSLVKSIRSIARKIDFSLDHSVIELHGRCSNCE